MWRGSLRCAGRQHGAPASLAGWSRLSAEMVASAAVEEQEVETEAPVGDEHLLTPAALEELLRLSGQKHTGSVPSILPLYVGMRLLLFAKDCVRFDLRKGCECVHEQVIFDIASSPPP